MTYDVVALVRQAPDMRVLADAMVRAGRRLRVRGAGEGAVIQLCDDDGRALLSIEAAQRVDVPSEVERLLGSDTARRMPHPCWWVEARATHPRDGDEDTAALAHRFATGLVDRLGGTVWPTRPREDGPSGREDRPR
ncbi:hypothetical protein [Salinactinospora qingdaonensis]|uniref:YjbR protein n=1 Tax=Salinactinospora qingdaonensis TaxID=702744 RepID=A0ABP7F650_9ACTN